MSVWGGRPGADKNEGGGGGEDTDFGQSRFGHPDLTNFGQSNFGQSISGSGFCSNGWGPNPEKIGPRRVGLQISRFFSVSTTSFALFVSHCVFSRWILVVFVKTPEGWVPRKVGNPKFGALFSLSRHRFAVSVSLWGSSRGILVVFWSASALKCARLDFSGCRVRAPAARSGLPTLRGSTLRGSTLRGPTFSGFGPPPFGATALRGLHPSVLHTSGLHPLGAPPFVVQKFNIWKLAEVEIGRSRNWPKSNWPKTRTMLIVPPFRFFFLFLFHFFFLFFILTFWMVKGASKNWPKLHLAQVELPKKEKTMAQVEIGPSRTRLIPQWMFSLQVGSWKKTRVLPSAETEYQLTLAANWSDRPWTDLGQAGQLRCGEGGLGRVAWESDPGGHMPLRPGPVRARTRPTLANSDFGQDLVSTLANFYFGQFWANKKIGFKNRKKPSLKQKNKKNTGPAMLHMKACWKSKGGNLGV